MAFLHAAQDIPTTRYVCGWCNHTVASARGWRGQGTEPTASGDYRYMTIAVCPSCHQPTFIGHDKQVPGAPVGDEVPHLPDDVSALYDEARSCAKDGSYTAAVLLGRKILMHVAVEKAHQRGDRSPTTWSG